MLEVDDEDLMSRNEMIRIVIWKAFCRKSYLRTPKVTDDCSCFVELRQSFLFYKIIDDIRGIKTALFENSALYSHP